MAAKNGKMQPNTTASKEARSKTAGPNGYGSVNALCGSHPWLIR